MKPLGTVGGRACRSLIALTLLATGCGSPRSNPAARPPEAPTLRVAAASDLQVALPALAERFTKESGVKTSLTFGASGQLAEQIKQGAPFDVFLAANQSFVNDLAAQGFIPPESIRPYARGTLVLVVHRESGRPIERLSDLRRSEVKKIALANPAFAPYGAAGKQVLERAGLWPAVEPKTVQAETVRQALQFVQSGNVEAGLVGKSIADVPEVRVVEVDPTLYDPIVQGLGVVARTKHPELAEKFIRFLLSAEGQAILSKFGFSPVGSAP